MHTAVLTRRQNANGCHLKVHCTLQYSPEEHYADSWLRMPPKGALHTAVLTRVYCADRWFRMLGEVLGTRRQSS